MNSQKILAAVCRGEAPLRTSPIKNTRWPPRPPLHIHFSPGPLVAGSFPLSSAQFDRRQRRDLYSLRMRGRANCHKEARSTGRAKNEILIFKKRAFFLITCFLSIRNSSKGGKNRIDNGPGAFYARRQSIRIMGVKELHKSFTKVLRSSGFLGSSADSSPPSSPDLF